MLDRLARPPDPLKCLEKPELPDAGEYLQHTLADDILLLDLLDFLGGPVKVDDDEVAAVIDGLVHSHGGRGMVQNRRQLRSHCLRRLTHMRFLNLA